MSQSFEKKERSFTRLRPLTTSGLAGLMLILGMLGPVGNQFGYDRTGFRAFVLGPIPRRDVLIGKNLSFFPLALVTMLAVVGLAQWSNPMRLDHLAAVLLQLIPMYLLPHWRLASLFLPQF